MERSTQASGAEASKLPLAAPRVVRFHPSNSCLHAGRSGLLRAVERVSSRRKKKAISVSFVDAARCAPLSGPGLVTSALDPEVAGIQELMHVNSFDEITSMSRKTIREQLTPAKAESLATLTYRLQPPDGGKVRQGEYRLTEGQWLDLIKGPEAATKEQRA